MSNDQPRWADEPESLDETAEILADAETMAQLRQARDEVARGEV